MGINLKLSSSPNGTRNVSFNPVIVSTETNIFGMDRSAPTNYLVPGNGNPAVSTSAYYQMFGLYNFRPYDLLQWGAVGATAMAANGGKRYIWCCSPDHPSVGAYSWTGGEGFCIGYSSQPSVFPAKMEPIPRLQLVGTYFGTGSPSPAGYSISGGFTTYEFPMLVYNPDDADGLPVYLFAECGPGNRGALWRSNDFLNFTIKEISHYHTSPNWSSFQRLFERTGVNQFRSVGLGTPTAQPTVWTTTDGINYVNSGVPVVGLHSSVPDPAGSWYQFDGHFTVGGQRYGVGQERATGNVQHVTIYSMDNTTFDKIESPPKVRLQSSVGSGAYGPSGFPGPNFLQEATGYEEDGILIVTPKYGFVSDVNTTANGAGRGGAPYNNADAGLDHQFFDRIIVRVNDAAARLAAPVQVTASCAASTATIAWRDALPQNTYRLYRGTSATTQATLVGDYTGVTSATDSPSTGRYWYKLVTLDNGTERGSRIVSIYVSSSEARVNAHIDRVLEDGADPTTINRAFLDRAVAALDTIGLWNILELWTHPAFGVKKSGSVITKVYDLGTTRLPRSDDFKPTTSNTTYSATGVNGGPCWANSTTSAYGYWGHRMRGNTIQQKRQITILAAYERTQTSSDLTFVGSGPIWGTAYDGSKILCLKHTAGSPGSIEFSLSDETSVKTASVTASGSGLQIAIGTYDGTSMYAYTGSTAGTAVTTLDPNPDFGRTSGTPGSILSSLAGGRNYTATSSGTSNDVFNRPGIGNGKIMPILGSGSVHCHSFKHSDPANDATIFNEANSQGEIQCVLVLEGAANPTQIGQLITELQSAADW